MDKRTIPDIASFLEQLGRRGSESVFQGEVWREVVIDPHNEAREAVYFRASAIMLFEPGISDSGFLMECIQPCGSNYAGEDSHGTRQAEHWSDMLDRLCDEMGLTVWEGRIESA